MQENFVWFIIILIRFHLRCNGLTDRGYAYFSVVRAQWTLSSWMCGWRNGLYLIANDTSFQIQANCVESGKLRLGFSGIYRAVFVLQILGPTVYLISFIAQEKNTYRLFWTLPLMWHGHIFTNCLIYIVHKIQMIL